MRFMITASPAADYDPKSQRPPDAALLTAYMKFNEEMHEAGVLVASEGLNPEAKSARVGTRNGKRVVLDGPFAESKELVGGFYLIDVASREEAIKWALRCPTGLGTDELLTIHPMTEASDLPPEVRALIEKAAPTWSASWVEKRR